MSQDIVSFYLWVTFNRLNRLTTRHYWLALLEARNKNIFNDTDSVMLDAKTGKMH